MRILCNFLQVFVAIGILHIYAVEAACEFTVSEPINLSNTPAYISGGGDLSSSDDGTIHVVWRERSQEILASRSTDGGVSFTTPIIVFPFSGGQTKYPQIEHSGDNVHVTHTYYPPSGGAKIAYAHSINGGVTFSEPVIVSPSYIYSSITSSIAIDDSGYVGLVWLGYTFAEYPPTGVYFCYSLDNGSTFSEPVFLVDGKSPDIAVNEKGLYIVWVNYSTGGAYFTRSPDGGKTFSWPNNLSNTSAKTWSTNIDLDSAGNIYVTWEEEAATNDRRVFFSMSKDNGTTFTSPKLLSSPGKNSHYHSLVVGGDKSVNITWTARTKHPDNTSEWDSFFVKSFNKGLTFSEPVALSNIKDNLLYTPISWLGPGRLGFVFSVAYENDMTDVLFSIGQYSPLGQSNPMSWLQLLLLDNH